MNVRFELHVVNDIACRRYSGRTARLSTHCSRKAAEQALLDRLDSHSLCRSAYEIREAQA